ncbi:hypothetical protein KUCAC02_029621 [Chaenocephalus aceratus]|nr:hypothetical protein KUCAC02_029621 [Chaenocephalus aceratus]
METHSRGRCKKSRMRVGGLEPQNVLSIRVAQLRFSTLVTGSSPRVGTGAPPESRWEIDGGPSGDDTLCLDSSTSLHLAANRLVVIEGEVWECSLLRVNKRLLITGRQQVLPPRESTGVRSWRL